MIGMMRGRGTLAGDGMADKENAAEGTISAANIRPTAWRFDLVTIAQGQRNWLDNEAVAAELEEVRERMGDISQAALAGAFARFWRGWLAYDTNGQRWMVYSIRQWKPARFETVLKDVGLFVKKMLPDQNAGTKKTWLTHGTFVAVETLARGYLSPRFDTFPELLGLPGGWLLNTIDGKVERNLHAYNISRYLPDEIGNPEQWDTPSVKWANFVDDCLAHYPVAERLPVAKYLQTWAGAALTGDAEAVQQMLFLYGQPGTGKSTFTETLLTVFGHYGTTVSGTRVARENNQHPQWLAGLQGRRLVTINELPARGNWQSEHLDSVIDGGTVEANRMRQDSINFHSSAFVVATGNHRPTAPTGSGIWRRLRIVQFQAKPTSPDPHLGKALRADLPGVFAWVLEGLDRYIAQGRTLVTPDVIKTDTSEYEVDADPIRQFIDDCLVTNDGARVEVKALYAAYVAWHEVNGTGKAMGATQFSNRLNDAGYPRSVVVKTAGKTVRYRMGIGLLG